MFYSPKEYLPKTLIKGEKRYAVGQLGSLSDIVPMAQADSPCMMAMAKSAECSSDLPAPHSHAAVKGKPRWRVIPRNGCPFSGLF